MHWKCKKKKKKQSGFQICTLLVKPFAISKIFSSAHQGCIFFYQTYNKKNKNKNSEGSCDTEDWSNDAKN